MYIVTESALQFGYTLKVKKEQEAVKGFLDGRDVFVALATSLEILIVRSKSNISSPDIIIIDNNSRVETALKKWGGGGGKSWFWSNKIINLYYNTA